LAVFLYYVNKNINKANIEGSVGMRQNLVLQSYQEGEKTLFYIDMAAKYAAEDAYMSTVFYGAMPDASPCGQYYNLAVWDFEDDDCLPMNALNENSNLKDSFETQMNANLAEYFRLAGLPIPENNYKVSIFEEKGKTIVSGDTISPLSFDIKKFDAQQKTITSYAPIDLPPAPVGKTTKERIDYIIKTYGPTIKKYCDPEGIPLASMAALIMKESSGNAYLISTTGCAGLNQFCYSTAKGYPSIFQKLTPCSCSDAACKYGIASCNANNDDRFNTEDSLNAGCKLLSSNVKYFKDYTAKLDFALAAYNAGPAPIKAAIQNTGEPDPAWTAVSAQITPELLDRNGYSSWSYEKRANKVKEVRGYVVRINSFTQEAEKQLSAETIPAPAQEEVKV